LKLLTVLRFKADLELLGFAKRLMELGVNPVVEALIFGGDLEEAQDYVVRGARKVYVVEGDPRNLDWLLASILKAFELSKPDYLLLLSDKNGKEVGARVAQRLKAGSIADVVDVVRVNGEISFVRIVLSGKAISYEKSVTPTVILVSPRKFEPPPPQQQLGEVLSLKVPKPDERVKVVRIEEKRKAELKLEEAEFIVAVGRGLKRQEDLKIVQELAQLLGAQVGCTRPIAADMGWLPEWIGFSGKKVKPRLYLALGISGQTQHVTGIMDSKVVVAVNKDVKAPIFDYADYYVVSDLYEYVPALIKALKRLSRKEA